MVDEGTSGPRAVYRVVAKDDDISMIGQSFKEVLDATKHQDDKIGRFLTAMAFLTTGAVAFLFRTDVLRARFSFKSTDLPSWTAGGEYPLIAWSAYGFFVFILFSLALLLLSLTTPLRLPGRRLSHGPPLRGSRLFFTHIADEPANVWFQRWDPTRKERIRSELHRSYVIETHNLAERARVKYGHTIEAGVLFVYSLLFLGLAVVLAITAITYQTPLNASPIEWSREVRIAIGLVIAAQVFTQIYAHMAAENTSRQLVRDALVTRDKDALLKYEAARSLRWLLLFMPMFVAACLVPSSDASERWVGGILAVLAIALSTYATRRRWCSGSIRSWPWIRLIFTALLPAVLASACLAVGGAWTLAAALLPSLGLALQSVTANYRRELRYHKLPPEA